MAELALYRLTPVRTSFYTGHAMEFSAIFPIREHCLYLDHATLAPLPQPVVVAVAEALKHYQQEGFWESRELNQLDHKVRMLLSQIAGCEPSDVSLFPDATTALAALFAGLELPARTEFFLAAEDPEEVHPLVFLLQRLGRPATLLEPARWPQLAHILEAKAPERAVVYLPWVDAAGWVGDFPAVAKELKSRGCLVVLDGSQAVPCRPESFAELDLAALLLPSHTWLLGPRGACALITTPDLRERWHPV
ncbi:MAG: aminotransferase class V-fold PLP-dependent enzyme, partial [Thermoanaerobaculum sp.]